MKANERALLRELNKSPFIKFPIKEITTTAHKVFIIIQVKLGGVEIPTSKDFRPLQRQFVTDTNIVFERIQRLVRCVVDCKSVDCDSVSTRYALDLARSLGAGYWESSSLQLRQIPQIGPVMAHKLIDNNIKTVEQLATLDTSNIERVTGRNPPYGKRLQDLLADFPRLALTIEPIGRPLYKTGEYPMLDVRARIGLTNVKLPKWLGRFPAVTFMAETTGGDLVHFWRGCLKKLDQGNELRFTVKLSSPTDEIKCYLACDEIVGTLRSCVLRPDVLASAFPPPKDINIAKPRAQLQRFSTPENDVFGEDIDDETMVAMARGAEVGPSHYGSNPDDFHDIDDLDEKRGAKQVNKHGTVNQQESFQMNNGKWTCNHACRNNQLTRSGHPCKHRCCINGLDKPPKKNKRKVC